MLRARSRLRRTTLYNPPAAPLLSSFNRALGATFLGVMLAYWLTLVSLTGVALVAMLGAFVGLVAAATSSR